MTEKLEHAIIIGAMKAGTNFLYHSLIQHPSICPCIVKEPDFFSRKFGPPQYKKGAYMDLFSTAPEHTFTLEASVGYTKYPLEKGVVARMKQQIDSPKLIYLVRNPFDRIESHYNFMRGRKGWNLNIDDDHLIYCSRYMMQLEQYLAYYRKDSFCIILFEEIIANPLDTFKRVFHFLGILDHEIDLNNTITNPTTPVSTTYLTIKNQLNFLKHLVPSDHREKAKKILKRFSPGNRRNLSMQQRERIHRLLEKDMVSLHENFAVDIERWGFPVA
jgi:hypothetical protein